MEASSIVSLVIWGVAGLFVLVFAALTLAKTFFTTDQQTVRMVRRFGKFKHVSEAGLGIKAPWLDDVSEPLSLRTLQHNVRVETITKDKVSLHLTVSVQYQVLQGRAYDAFYKLQNPTSQIESYVFDAVRARVPEMDLDQVFQNKGEIANAVENELKKDMEDFGYGISKALVTEVDPDPKVKAAMNDINTAQREQIAANARGEAQKILTIKAAEAEAEKKKLQGQGVANERTAIAQGIRESASLLKEALGEGIDAQHVMDILMMTQAYDALRDIGANSRTNVVFLPNTAGGLHDLVTATMSSMTAANQLAKDNSKPVDSDKASKQ